MTTKRPRPIKTTVSSRYQTVIPSEIREKFAIREGSRIAWIDKGESIEVIPLPGKPWKEFRGAGRGADYLTDLAVYRQRERENERGREEDPDMGSQPDTVSKEERPE